MTDGTSVLHPSRLTDGPKPILPAAGDLGLGSGGSWFRPS